MDETLPMKHIGINVKMMFQPQTMKVINSVGLSFLGLLCDIGSDTIASLLLGDPMFSPVPSQSRFPIEE